MSSGRDHDKFNMTLCAIAASASVVTGSSQGLLACVGFAAGTLILSPDLDLKQSNPSRRLGIFKPLFAPYRRLAGHHRSSISHSPLLSNFVRVAYCLVPAIAYLAYTRQLEQLRWLLSDRFIAVYVGLELSTITHLILDWQYSVKRKIRHF